MAMRNLLGWLATAALLAGLGCTQASPPAERAARPAEPAPAAAATPAASPTAPRRRWR